MSKIELDDLVLIAEKLSEELSFYRGKKIFLTGGTGFFGKWILEAINYLNSISNLDLKIVVLSRNPNKFQCQYPHLCKDKNISFLEGDIRNFTFPGEKFDYIIHAATDASATVNRTNPELMRSTIMDGARHITEFANYIKCQINS